MAKQTENAEAQGTGGGGQEKPGQRTARRSGAARTGPKARSASRRGKTPVALQKLLKGEHARLEQMFRTYESADAAQKDEALRGLAQELIIQMIVKEQVLYPALQEAKVEDAQVDEALVSYDVAKFLIRDILGSRSEDRYRDAKVSLLAQTVEHHVAKEEQPRQGLLAKAAGIDDAAVLARMQECRKALEADHEGGIPEPMPALTFNRQPGPTRRLGEDNTMSQNGPDRDEHGRFMSHDDSQRGRGDGGGGRYSRMEEDDRGRGMQSRGGRYADDDSENRGRGRGDNDRGGNDRGNDRDRHDSDRDRGQGGWFGDSRGHSQASRTGWDERRREGSDRGESGWFGDSDGHSDASRRGWDTRRREGTDHDSGWHGDPQGHAEASRRGWDTRRREGTEHDSGWHGDPEGHSQASRTGWETRRREGTDRFGDDDRGRGRASGGFESRGGGYDNESRGRGPDNEGRGGRSGGGYESRGNDRGSNDRGSGGREQGQGGWFGDSQGHAEASRRGWETRRDDDDDRGGRGRR